MVTEKTLERINELYHKSKAEGLTDAELAEQKQLRAEYVKAFRENLRGQLESIKIKNPDGSLIDVKARHDEKMKRYVRIHFFEEFKGSLYRQTMFAEFEMEAHAKAEQGEVLSAESLCAMYKKLNEKYFGPDMVIDDEIALEWARIPHFYTPFYVYQYATGYSAAIAISTKILAGDEQVIEGQAALQCTLLSFLSCAE